MKTDKSIRNISIASIKRSTIKPYDFPLTKFFETEKLTELNNNTLELSATIENELPIAQTIIDPMNWTLVTTRQIISCIDGFTKIAPTDKVIKSEWGDFKGYRKTAFTIGFVLLDDQQKVEIFIETGRASMIIIHAIMTSIVLVRR